MTVLLDVAPGPFEMGLVCGVCLGLVLLVGGGIAAVVMVMRKKKS